MRKSRVLAVLIGLVLIGVLLLAWMLTSKRSGQAATLPGNSEDAGKRAIELEGGADLEPTHAQSRADVATTEHSETATSAKNPSLRINVLYASGRDEHPAGLDVGVANFSGSILQTRQVAPNEFLLVEEPPGTYVVAAKAQGFRTSVVRAQMSAGVPESKTTITLTPERSVRVGWSSPDGRPIRESLADTEFDDEGRCQLEVLATKFRPGEDAVERNYALARLSRVFVQSTDPSGGRSVIADEPESNDRREPPDTLGYLKIDEEGSLWVSAYCNREWIASEPLDALAGEIVFVSPLVRAGGGVRVRVVDQVTSAPVQAASIHFDEERFVVSKTDAEGICEHQRLPPGTHTLTIRNGIHLEKRVEFTVRAGETTDVGTIELEKGFLFAYFRVVDESGAPCSGARFEMVELEESRPIHHPYTRYIASCDVPRRAGDTNPDANLRFVAVSPVRCLLRCRSSEIDAAPRIVQPEEMTRSGKSGVIARIVVHPAGTARFVLDPPIAKGTQLMIETTAGQPLRELEVDLFGVATTDILAGSYRLHLVEYGRASGSIEVRVDSNPFVFEIHR